MYRPFSRRQIVDNLLHLRELFRRIKPSSEMENLAQEKRELVIRDLLSNVARSNQHPTLHAVLEIADLFSLTLGRAPNYLATIWKGFENAASYGMAEAPASSSRMRSNAICSSTYRQASPSAKGWASMLRCANWCWSGRPTSRSAHWRERDGSSRVRFTCASVKKTASGPAFLPVRLLWWSPSAKRSANGLTRERSICLNSAMDTDVAAVW
jgi:hypothetical protein